MTMRDRETPASGQRFTGHTRRSALQILAGSAGGLLLGRALANDAASRPLAHDDDADDADDHDNSGHGRGRGRGRGGDDDRGRNEATGDDARAAVPAADIPSGAIVVRIVSDDAGGFVPSELTVDPGDAVTFVNEHSDEHTATGSGFDTGIIPSGGVATVRLETTGRFAYACQIHPEMTGIIDVGAATPRETAQSASATPPATSISIVDFTFEPPSVTIRPGATIEWANDDTVPHTVTSSTGAFDSGILDPGSRFYWTASKTGSFAYHCQLHPQMEGTVIVEGEPIAAATPAPAATPVNAVSSQQSEDERVDVAIIDFSFDPARVEVRSGATVTWRNAGDAPHTATGQFADSGVIEPGESFSWRFDAPGTFDYACAFHPNMTGSVIVSGSN
jgi:plastocyanin